MRKFKAHKGFRRLNKISYMAIILFLIMSYGWYLDLCYEEYGGTILLIQITTILFMVGGLKQILGILGEGGTAGAMSDGIDLPDLG